MGTLRTSLIVAYTASLALMGCTDSMREGIACSAEGECPNGQSCYDDVCLSEAPEPDGPDSVEDGTPPSVLSISPDDGAIDLAAGTAVVVQFSEPMDPETTLDAIEIEPATEILSYQWNEAFDELTINYALEAAEADYPEVPGTKLYTVELSAAAQDTTGNVLEADAVTSFSMNRFQVHSFSLNTALGGHSTNPYSAGYSFVGAADFGGQRWHGYMSFDVSAFPSDAITAVDSAILDTHVWYLVGDPFPRFGRLTLEHSTFASRTEAATGPVLRDLGTLIPPDPAPQAGDRYASDVTGAFLDDIAYRADRADRSQYLLKFPDAPTAIEGDHRAFIIPSEARAVEAEMPPTRLIVRTRVD